MFVSFSATMTSDTASAAYSRPPRAAVTPAKMLAQARTSVTATAYCARKEVRVMMRSLNASPAKGFPDDRLSSAGR
jgi:hypothetical protein